MDVYQLKAVLSADIGNFQSGLKQAISSLTEFEKGMSGFDKVSGALKGVGAGLTLGVTAPLTALGVASVKTSSEFDAQMSKVQAISGATGSEMDILRAKAKEMGANTKFSASESAEALKFMGMAGWEAQQMIEGLPGVINLAAASGEELGLVSDIVTDSLSGFGLQAEDAAHFADILATTATSSNTNVGLMGETFKYVAPLAGALGYDVEDVAVATGLMANAGIKGSQAGTSLRSALTRLASPTKEVDRGMELLGLSIEDVQGLSLDETLWTFRNAFAGLDETQQAQAASLIFGKNAMSGMLAIINASDEEYNKLSDAIYNASGSAEEMAGIMEDNLKGSITSMKSALEGLQIVIGERLEAAIRKIVDKITEWARAFNELDPGTQDLIVNIGLIVAAIGPALLAIGKMMDTFKKMGKTIETLKKGLSTLGTLLKTNPWIFVVAGLIAAAVLIYKHWDEIKEYLTQLWDSIKEVAQGLWDGIIETLETVIEGIKQAWENTKEFFINLWDSIKQGAVDGWNGIKDGIGSVIETIKEFVSQHFEGLGQALSNIWNNIKEIAKSTWELIKNVIIGPILVLIQALTGDWEGAKESLIQIWENIKESATNIWNNLKEAIQTATDAVQEVIKTIWDAIKEFIKTTWDNIVETVKNAVDKFKENVKTGFEKTKETIQTNVKEFVQKVKEGFEKMVEKVKETIPKIPEKVKEGFSKAIEAGKSFISQAVSVGKDLIMGFVEGVKNFASNLVSSVKNAVSSAISGAKSILGINSPSRVFKKIGGYTMEGFAIGIDKGGKNAVNSVRGVVGDMINSYENVDNIPQLNSLKSQSKQEVDYMINDNLSSKQPAVITLALGGRNFKTLVEDITDTQGKIARLDEVYGW